LKEASAGRFSHILALCLRLRCAEAMAGRKLEDSLFRRLRSGIPSFCQKWHQAKYQPYDSQDKRDKAYLSRYAISRISCIPCPAQIAQPFNGSQFDLICPPKSNAKFVSRWRVKLYDCIFFWAATYRKQFVLVADCYIADRTSAKAVLTRVYPGGSRNARHVFPTIFVSQFVGCQCLLTHVPLSITVRYPCHPLDS
jgi:hypothetical protein